MEYGIVVAITRENGIGKDGTQPWPRQDNDMKFFIEHTSTVKYKNKINAVIMGRKTWESIPNKFRPQKNRINIVQSRNTIVLPPDVILCNSQNEALQWCKKHKEYTNDDEYKDDSNTIEEKINIDNVYIIGGSQVYQEAQLDINCTRQYITQVLKDYICDTFIPKFDDRYKQIYQSDIIWEVCNTVPTQRQIYERNNTLGIGPYHQRWKGGNEEEKQYLSLIQKIQEYGSLKKDRTGVGTYSIFGSQMRFSLRNNTFPLLTTKKVFFRGVFEEQLWFIHGCTDSKQLAERGVHIWDDNGSREFLDKMNLYDREVGDQGPIYSFQWRHFGAKYIDCNTNYTNQGVDQQMEQIKNIRTNPTSRRQQQSSWNPMDQDKMALPPCHILCQFYVNNNELSCHMYQRSCDIGLGVPFNIASYSLLTYMIAHITNLSPGDFVYSMGDIHIYLNHVDALKEQQNRMPYEFPNIEIIPRDDLKEITDFKISDIKLSNYKFHKALHMKMAV